MCKAQYLKETFCIEAKHASNNRKQDKHGKSDRIIFCHCKYNTKAKQNHYDGHFKWWKVGLP